MSEIKHRQENKIPYLVDFDGTIAENLDWDSVRAVKIGKPIWPMIKALRACRGRVIIFTARPSWMEAKLALWLANHNVPYEHIEFGKRIGIRVDDMNLSIDDFVKQFGGEV